MICMIKQLYGEQNETTVDYTPFSQSDVDAAVAASTANSNTQLAEALTAQAAAEEMQQKPVAKAAAELNSQKH